MCDTLHRRPWAPRGGSQVEATYMGSIPQLTTTKLIFARKHHKEAIFSTTPRSNDLHTKFRVHKTSTFPKSFIIIQKHTENSKMQKEHKTVYASISGIHLMHKLQRVNYYLQNLKLRYFTLCNTNGIFCIKKTFIPSENLLKTLNPLTERPATK